METAATARERVRRPTVNNPRRRKSSGLGAREIRRLLQLGICLAIFLVLFVGNSFFPGHLAKLRGTLQETLHETTNFQEVFSNLGKSVAKKVPAGDLIGDLWVEVFGAGKPAEAAGTLPPLSATNRPPNSADFNGYTSTMSVDTVTAEGLLSRLQTPAAPAITPTPAVTVPPVADEPIPTPSPQPTSHPYDGPPLPERVSMEYQDLALRETTVPVMGSLTSNYGYRNHPQSGKMEFHYGADIGADTGTEIDAFAAGTVDFIGQSPAYGMYIQLRHDSGVTTFYAHCSKLCKNRGDKVSMGEKIAEVGATGDATGPHLHLEVKRDGIFYDPTYYLENR
ncbi:MAG: peptidoglycan DD-metalloendopeptidase family protein [Oscillospiraceae bacterium]